MELDDFFERLKAEPIPDLSGIDGEQLAMRASREKRHGRVILTTAAVAALMIGMAGSLPAPGAASASVVPFGPPSSLVPLVQLERG
jgi:hypothetical protein